MLYLLKQDKGDSIFYLFKDQEYIIGRKNSDIVITDDQSISRKHAILNTKGNCVTLTDCKSKYGTFHNGKQLREDTEVNLKEDDVIKFGIFQSSYRFEKLNVITTSSGLTDDQKKTLTTKLNSIGGLFKNSWDNSCCYLTAQEIILTIKVLLAVIDDKPIVTPKFWDELILNIKNNKPPPDVNRFKPPMNETLMNQDISVNPARKSLFKGKTFVFTNDKVKKKMGELICKTGGSVVSWEKHQVSLSDIKQSKNKYIFINDEAEKIPESLKDIHKYLEILGERMIPIQEIAMAIVYCSCEKDCNPKFNRIHNVFKKPSSDSESQVFSLAPNTQSQDLTSLEITKKEIVIPTSLEPDLDMIVPLKEISVSKVTQENPPKKFKFDKSQASSTSVSSNQSIHSVFLSKKRSADDSLSPSPKKIIKQTQMASFFNNLSSSKRKSDDNLNISRKKNTKANPFALFRQDRELVTEKSSNPFLAFRVKEERRSEIVNNPFSKISNRSQVEPEIESPIEIQSNQAPSLVYSDIWLSKKMKKEDADCTTHSNVELDPEMQKIYDLFRDTVIVETIPANSFRISIPVTQSTLETSSQKRNFKKFRKVQPKHPQTTIIVTTFRNGVDMLDGEENDKNCNEIEERHKLKKPAKATFDF